MAAGALLLASCSHDDGTVKIQLPKDFKEKTLVVSHLTLDNIYKAKKQDDLKIVYDTLKVKDGVAEMSLDSAGPSQYSIYPPVMTTMQPMFYGSPGDELVVDIKSFEPLNYSVTGSELMDDITALNASVFPILQENMARMNRGEEISEAQAKEMADKYDAAIKKFVAEHPKSPAIPYAIMDLSGDDFKTAYDNMTPEARKSILMPMAELLNAEVEGMQAERAEEDARKAEVASGKITAPNFTLPDLNGKKVSLSDFKGKWVVLDFWGSWCGWCVKGFPALREAYEKYGNKIVVIGIDCNESEEDWRAGVKQHKIPWLNLYNGHNKDLYVDYNITGFPTKAIISPEGKLVDLTTGEDPTFYDRLAQFVGQ